MAATAPGRAIVSFLPKGRPFEGGPPVSKSKLAPPRLPVPLLQLARHLRAIETVPHLDVMVVSGPPASGKTVFAAQAFHGFRAAGIAAGWVSCDGKPGHAVMPVVARALDDAIDAPARERRATSAGDPATLAIELANGVHDHGASVLLCLDDADGALDGDPDGFLAHLIDHAPTNLHILLTTQRPRRILETRIDRHRAIAWIPPADLALTDAEAAEAVAARGVVLDARAVSALNRRLAGWWGGLRQVAPPGVGGLPGSGSGGRDAIGAAYGAPVFAGIVASLPEEKRDVLMRCAVPPVLTAELAGLLAEGPRAGELLTHLAGEGCFIEVAGEHICLHPAFRAYLLEGFSGEPHLLADLRRRASAWFVIRDEPMRAIALLSENGEAEAIAAAVIQHGMGVLDRGGLILLGAALARIPEERIAHDARLARIALWRRALGGFGPDSPHEPASRLVPEHADLLEDLWGSMRGRTAPVRTGLAGDLSGFPARLAAALAGEAALRAGRPRAAQSALAPLLRRARHGGIGLAEARAFIAMADFHRAQGRLPAAEQLLREGWTLAAGEAQGYPEAASLLGVSLASLRYLQNDLAGAGALMARDFAPLCHLGGGEILLRGYRMAIRMASSEGRTGEALGLIEQAEDVAAEHDNLPLTALAAVERARLRLPFMTEPDAILASADEEAAVADPASGAARVFAIFAEARVYEAITNLDRPHLTAVAARTRRLAAAQDDIELRIAGTLFDVLPQLSGRCDRMVEIDTVRFLNQAARLGFVRTIIDILDVTGIRTTQDFEGDVAAGSFLALLRRAPAGADGSPPALSLLTHREIEVVAALSLGETNKMIARKLGLTPETVKWHMKILMRKLRAGNRVEVVENARTLGLAPRC